MYYNILCLSTSTYLHNLSETSEKIFFLPTEFVRKKYINEVLHIYILSSEIWGV